MLRKADIGLLIAVLATLVAATEIGYINGGYSSVILALGAALALAVGRTEATMQERQDSARMSTPLGSLEVEGPNLFNRMLGSSTATNILLLGLAAGLYYHDNATGELQRRQTAAIEVANYLSTQPEEVRLALGKRMQVPEALRKQLTP